MGNSSYSICSLVSEAQSDPDCFGQGGRRVKRVSKRKEKKRKRKKNSTQWPTVWGSLLLDYVIVAKIAQLL